MNVIHPHMLTDGDLQAMELHVADYDSTLVGDDVYVEGDLVEVASGKVKKSQQTTPANVPALFLAGQSHAQPYAVGTYLADWGVPLNVIPSVNRFVMTYQSNSADATPYVFASGDLQAVQARARREIAWNDTEKCYTVRNGTTNPAVTLLGVFKGAVGDSNVQVIVRLDPGGAATLGAAGPTGPTGPTGPAGPTGPTGPGA